MSEFLDDEKLGPAIRQLTQGTGVRCAVAFWGDGAAEALFLGRVPSGARLICDLSMGGTNPTELRALGAPWNKNLRHLPGLHAKVYLSNKGLIVASANASNNGIGFLEVPGLVEVGTFHPLGSEVWHRGTDWFDRVWNRAKPVDEAALELARASWGHKPRIRGARLLREPDPTSLLDVVAADPERFRGVGFVFTLGTSTEKQRDETAVAVIEADKRRAVSLLSKSEQRALARWSVGDVFSEWDPEDIRAWPQLFVCAHRGARGQIRYWFYERVHTAVLEGDRGMVLARRPGTIRRKLGFQHGRLAMAAADEDRLQAIFEYVAEDGHQLYESGAKLASLLADLSLLR